MNVAPNEFTSGPEPLSFGHTTVLKGEVVGFLAPRAGGVYVDATVGGGGHAEAILESAPGARLVGLDQDERAVVFARERLSRFGYAVTIVQARFRTSPTSWRGSASKRSTESSPISG